MKKIIILTSFFLLLIQTSFAQKKDVKIIISESKEAYEQGDFETSKNKILEAKSLFKSNPPPIVLSLEILSKSEIIKIAPLSDYSQIENTRRLANNYLKNPKSKTDKYYNDVLKENKILNTYPKDQASFLAVKQQMEQEEIAKKEAIVIAAATAKAREEEMAIIRENNRKSDSIKNETAKIEAEKNRIANAEAKAKNDQIERENEIKAEEVRKKQEKKYSQKLSSFSSLGFQSGEIATYGLLYERGGKRTVGFHISARTSNTSEEEILNGSGVENKTEIDLGPNFKIFNRFYLNIGVGYGYYDKILRNDYAGTLSLEKTGYLMATSGLMIRISRVININGGVSFMDVDKAFYKPEITFGISFNLKKKYSY